MFRRVSPEKARYSQSGARQTSNMPTLIHPNTGNEPVKPTTRPEFEAVFPSLVQDLTEHCKQYNSPENALKWFQDVRDHLSVP